MIAVQDFDWDEDLLDSVRREGSPRARVCCPSQVSVVLGRGSDPEIEVDVEAVRADGVPLLRRRGGGCSVVLDTGNVVVSCVLPLSGLGGTSRAFRVLSDWLIDGLMHAGVASVRPEGTSDLAVGTRKVGGACIYRTQGLLYYSATLLFIPDVNLVERYLRHPPREPGYRSGRSHSEFLGSLVNSVRPNDIEEFTDQIARRLSETLETSLDFESFFAGHRSGTTKKREVLA